MPSRHWGPLGRELPSQPLDEPTDFDAVISSRGGAGLEPARGIANTDDAPAGIASNEPEGELEEGGHETSKPSAIAGRRLLLVSSGSLASIFVVSILALYRRHHHRTAAPVVPSSASTHEPSTAAAASNTFGTDSRHPANASAAESPQWQIAVAAPPPSPSPSRIPSPPPPPTPSPPQSSPPLALPMSPPPRPPNVPPPYLKWPSRLEWDAHTKRYETHSLSAAQCSAMWADKAGLLRKMWSATPWRQRAKGEPNCWDRQRGHPTFVNRDPRHDFFFPLEQGAYCRETNWFEGNEGELGKPGQPPSFTRDARPVLGFDESIDAYCATQPHDNGKHTARGKASHAGNCVAANVNILSLFGERMPYNSCRNLEWQVCAALGKLPGQLSRKIYFAKAPAALDPSPHSARPLGKCGGWRDFRTPGDSDCLQTGFASDDVFFLEVCIYNEICSNGPSELFHLRAGQPWECELDARGLAKLRDMLLDEPDWGPPQGGA